MHETLLPAMAANRSLFNQTLGYGPEGELSLSERVKWISTGYPLSNFVFDLRFQEGSAQEEVDALLRTFQEKQIPTSWIIDPLCTPVSLPDLLARYPHAYQGHYTAMALSLREFSPRVERPEGFSLEEATSAADLAIWSRVLCEGFGITGTTAEHYQRIVVNAALASGPDFSFRHFVGFRSGKPICVTSLLLDGTMAGLYWVATIPQARRQKAAIATLSQLLTLAQQQGYAWSVLQATEMGAGVYTSLGFRPYYRETYFDGVTHD